MAGCSEATSALDTATERDIMESLEVHCLSLGLLIDMNLNRIPSSKMQGYSYSRKVAPSVEKQLMEFERVYRLIEV